MRKQLIPPPAGDDRTRAQGPQTRRPISPCGFDKECRALCQEAEAQNLME